MHHSSDAANWRDVPRPLILEKNITYMQIYERRRIVLTISFRVYGKADLWEQERNRRRHEQPC